MVNRILDERYNFQQQFLQHLKDNGYEIFRQDADFREKFPYEAIERKALMRFLHATQNDTLEKLEKIYHGALEDTIVSTINTEESKTRGSRLNVLKKGIEIANYHLNLLYTKPATTFNREACILYEQNIFSVSEEVYATPRQKKNESEEHGEAERVDLVIFLNGLAVIVIELKTNASGQNYRNAIRQYRESRNPKLKLFRWKSGALVFFAMDDQEVYMTTQINGGSTYFLPFNIGRGEGINTGAGNPVPLNGDLPVHYMWDDILKKDFLVEILYKFMFIQVTEKNNFVTGEKKRSEKVIFPRFHQLDLIRKLLADVKINKTSQNYLIQHSAGSGKTNSIAWLSHRLASWHDDDNKVIFDNVIICTDRVVVDRQLQQAVISLEHKSGMIRVMDEKCTSKDLKDALLGNTKIVATTIQKFPYIVDQVKNLRDKTFAVIIDEAHSSTAGKNMLAVARSLGSGDQSEMADYDSEQLIEAELRKNGKQSNVSFFAFTATPRNTTLQLFGRDVAENGRTEKAAFHLYSMKQAIEEGFILDVLQNYVTYKTFFNLNKTVEQDPKLKTVKAKREIAKYVQLHETNIAQRIEIIITHFRTTVMQELNGNAKAMVVTESREGAVRYYNAFNNYAKEKGYNDIKALIAFSGKVTVDGETYTEPGINGFPERSLPDEFDTEDYQVLLVADKYQTGFDQPKLCAMYILKKLKGINAVQTLSRLNRICPPYDDKKTFILDFANDYEDIESAFSKYYTTTILSNSVSPQSVYDIEMKIDGYFILQPADIDHFNVLLYKEKKVPKDNNIMNGYLLRARQRVYEHQIKVRKEILATIRGFIRLYEFISAATSFEDVELHKKYMFLSYLQSYLKFDEPGSGFSLRDKLAASGFLQKKEKEITASSINPDPVLKLPNAYEITLPEAEEKKLSEIIAEINAKTGNSFDDQIAVRMAMHIRDLMKQNEQLRNSARNNTQKDFELSYFDHVDEALLDGMDENRAFYSLLLRDAEIKKEVLSLFTGEIYRYLRNSN
jgi:type I restriction enzyme R subunit